jgi:hypothetical protein
LLPSPPRDVAIDGWLLSLARDTRHKTMIASDADEDLSPGQSAAMQVMYILQPRVGGDPVGEARRILAPALAN